MTQSSGGSSNRRLEAVDKKLIERMANATSDQLFTALRCASSDEQRQAPIELGDRGVLAAFEPIVDLLTSPDPDVGDGAAMGLRALGDPRAVRPILEATRARARHGWVSPVFVFAVTMLDPLQAHRELVDFVLHGSCLEALHAMHGLRDIWDDLPDADRENARALLEQQQRRRDIEDWRAEWIEEILTKGAWTPDERAWYEQ